MSEERLIIAGAGGFGRELLSWAADCHQAGSLPATAGFIDDKVKALPEGPPRLGAFQDYAPRPGDLFLVGAGHPVMKRRMIDSLRERGGRFGSLIHPTAKVGRACRHGTGVVLCPYSMNTADTRMGDFVYLLSFSGLGHDSVAGDFATISSHVDIMGHAEVGAGVLVGSGARILPGIKVGDGATVGAGAVVMRNVKPSTTVYAPPARLLPMGRR